MFYLQIVLVMIMDCNIAIYTEEKISSGIQQNSDL